jgi:hypothetical protein
VFHPCSAGIDDQRAPVPVPETLLAADSVAIDCDACPRDLGEAASTALEVLLSWDRFRIVQDRQKADVILLFSGNPYWGDYLTRDGPDPRPVFIDGVILTVIDPRTGKRLWADSRHWGSWRIRGATKDLIEELHDEMESQIRRWTVDDIFRCRGTPAYQNFAFATPEEALAKAASDVNRIADTPDRLTVSSPDVPDFCRRVHLVVGPDNKILGFEVLTSHAETLDVGDVLEQADQFEFTSGKDEQSQKVHFKAQTKDKKVLIEYDMQGRQSILSRVRFFY